MRKILLTSLAALLVPQIRAQTIDFETLPNGNATSDLMEISNQYAVAPFGVTFRILSRVTGQPLGFPRLAKVGPPRTAFVGCSNRADEPAANAGVCGTFLTDDSTLGVRGDLEVTYLTPVARAAGTMLDVDRQEAWTISAYDAMGALVDSITLTPPGTSPCGGTAGNGTAAAFSLASPTGADEITRLLFEYTGNSSIGSVGLAFDNFSPAESGLGSPTPGCVAVPNSTGLPAVTDALGSDDVLDNSLRLTARGLPPFALGYFIASPLAGLVMNPAGATGNICILNPASRFNRPGEMQNAGMCGMFDLAVDLTNVPVPTGATSLVPGQSWTFQAWYMDPQATTASNSNYATSVTIDFR